MSAARSFLMIFAMTVVLYMMAGESWWAASCGAAWSCIAYWDGLCRGRKQVQAQFDHLATATRELLDAMPSQQMTDGETDLADMLARFRAARLNAAIAVGRKKGGAA